MITNIPVEGNPGLYRDVYSGAILNCSDMEFSRYLQNKEKKLNEINEMKKIKDQVDEIGNMKEEISEIKEMMKLIINKLDSNL